MQKSAIRFYSMVASIVVLLVTMGFSQYKREPKSRNESGPLKTFLQEYFRDPSIPDDKTTRYFPAFVDLRDDGEKEVIVYVSGRYTCGTGGCFTLVLVPEGSSYRVVTQTTITRPPIRVLTTKSKGWHDIAVVVAGGGIQPGEAILSFDGETYPSNPTTPPARRLTEKVAGETVVPRDAEGKPLYQ
jgi:hypothetical protein